MEVWSTQNVRELSGTASPDYYAGPNHWTRLRERALGFQSIGDASRTTRHEAMREECEIVVSFDENRNDLHLSLNEWP
jgi:hypothetical protein